MNEDYQKFATDLYKKNDKISRSMRNLHKMHIANCGHPICYPVSTTSTLDNKNKVYMLANCSNCKKEYLLIIDGANIQCLDDEYIKTKYDSILVDGESHTTSGAVFKRIKE